ncbi:hypothetical protein E2C01_090575 [Portunus trituberculatus]|uniref:Uncharacterized protein n=1 Tax=Portunus trituberculatus TaxID=210409 RepID=A0A5B7JQQ9_PORTR|nr:hypothetical protein [Portunus trituberculatus]
MLMSPFHHAGLAGFKSSRDHQPQHGGPNPAHLRRGADPDLHAHAPGLLSALPQLRHLQATRTTQQ